MLGLQYQQPIPGIFRPSLTPPPSPPTFSLDAYNHGGSFQVGGYSGGGQAFVQQPLPPLSAKRRKLSSDGMMSGLYGAFQPAADDSFYGSQTSAQDSSRSKSQNYQAYNYNQNYDQRSSPSLSRGPTRQASPVQFEKPAPADNHPSRGRPAIAAYLVLPPEISNGRPGSLAEFASEVRGEKRSLWESSSTDYHHSDHLPLLV